MDAQLIVPWRGGCEYRERAWRWLRARYEAEGWDVVEAPAPDGPWNKAATVMPAVESSPADIVAVVDADVYTDGLARAVDAVATRRARWGMPHKKVLRLDEDGTAAFMAGDAPTSFAQPPYEGIWGGGAVVAHREVILSAPLDFRYVGWG